VIAPPGVQTGRDGRRTDSWRHGLCPRPLRPAPSRQPHPRSGAARVATTPRLSQVYDGGIRPYRELWKGGASAAQVNARISLPGRPAPTRLASPCQRRRTGPYASFSDPVTFASAACCVPAPESPRRSSPPSKHRRPPRAERLCIRTLPHGSAFEGNPDTLRTAEQGQRHSDRRRGDPSGVRPSYLPPWLCRRTHP
jgi:hypothetical protein